jgi:hypothetical protein
VTVSNTGTAPTKTWKVTWTWPGTQAIVNAWNATVTSSGKAVSAANRKLQRGRSRRKEHVLRLPGELQRHQYQPHSDLLGDLSLLGRLSRRGSLSRRGATVTQRTGR